MKVFLSDIPEEGLPVSGTIAPSIFGLDSEDSIRPRGDVEFDLKVYRFDDVLVLSGKVEGTFELQCVTCLEYFPYTARFPEWQSEVDIEERMDYFDPRESLRDEILLSLPVTPHCDELVEGRTCPKSETLSHLESDGEPLESEDSGPDIWGALDQFEEKQ